MPGRTRALKCWSDIIKPHTNACTRTHASLDLQTRNKPEEVFQGQRVINQGSCGSSFYTHSFKLANYTAHSTASQQTGGLVLETCHERASHNKVLRRQIWFRI